VTEKIQKLTAELNSERIEAPRNKLRGISDC